MVGKVIKPSALEMPSPCSLTCPISVLKAGTHAYAMQLTSWPRDLFADRGIYIFVFDTSQKYIYVEVIMVYYFIRENIWQDCIQQRMRPTSIRQVDGGRQAGARGSGNGTKYGPSAQI